MAINGSSDVTRHLYFFLLHFIYTWKQGVVPLNFTVSKKKLLCFLCWACVFIACVNTSVNLHSIGSSRSLNCVGCSQTFSKFYRLFQCTYCYFLEPSGGGNQKNMKCQLTGRENTVNRRGMIFAITLTSHTLYTWQPLLFLNHKEHSLY